VYTESVKIIGDVLSDVRSGKMFNTGAVKHVAENIAQLTLRNKGVLASVTKLKQFDNYTFHHSMNVSIFAASLAAHLKLDEKEIAIAANSGIMHDVGKMLVPENILNKPSKLTAEEFAIMKTHVELGYDIIKQSGEDMSSKGLVMEHHERHDGSGYPQGLKDEQISIQGKIGAVVDIYDAITSDRVYHKGMAATSALKLMFQWADKHINKSVFEFFIKNIGIYPVGSLVIMATQELAMVGKINNGRPTDPVVVVFMGKNGERLPIKVVDLSKSGVDRQKIIGLINPENVSVPKEVYRYIDSMNRIS
jgi:putative nucleotidyltransferase with HDIG domain